jgi:hypothetical protein
MTNTIDLQKDCKYIKTAPFALGQPNLKKQIKPGSISIPTN